MWLGAGDMIDSDHIAQYINRNIHSKCQSLAVFKMTKPICDGGYQTTPHKDAVRGFT